MKAFLLILKNVVIKTSPFFPPYSCLLPTDFFSFLHLNPHTMIPMKFARGIYMRCRFFDVNRKSFFFFCWVLHKSNLAYIFTEHYISWVTKYNEITVEKNCKYKNFFFTDVVIVIKFTLKVMDVHMKYTSSSSCIFFLL